MIEQTNNALKFRAFYVAGKVGKTGLTVTVDVYNPGDAKIVTAGSATEIGGGLYGYTLASGSVTAEGEYVAIFKTSDATVDAQHMAAVWVVGRGGIELLDATHQPTAEVIADAVADEALAGHSTVGTVGAALTAASSAGDPWATTTEQLDAYDAGTAARLFAKLNVGEPDAPVVVVPGPPADASMCTVYCYTEALTGAKRAGIVVTIKLSGKPSKSDRVLEAAAVTAETDADGFLSVNLQRTDVLTPAGLHYLVTCRELGLASVAMTLESETFDLGGLIV